MQPRATTHGRISAGHGATGHAPGHGVPDNAPGHGATGHGTAIGRDKDAIGHRKTAAGREWTATLALVAHYHRELRLSRKALSPGRRLGSDHPPTLPASTHFNNLATAAAAVT